MLRKSMIALCAAASVMALTPNFALARGGGGGGGGGHGGGGGGFGGGGGHAGGFGGGGMHAGSFGGGGGFAARGGNFQSFASAPVRGNVSAVQGNRFASGNFNHMGNGNFHHGFHRRGVFFAGGFWGPGYDYWDYPGYAYDDTYYDNGGCYIVQRRVHTSYGWRVRPVEVCS